MVAGILIGAVAMLAVLVAWEAITQRRRLNRRKVYEGGARGVRMGYISMLKHNEEADVDRLFGIKTRR